MSCGGSGRDKGRMGFQRGGASDVSLPSSVLGQGSVPIYVSNSMTGGSDPFFASEWEPIVSLSRHEGFHAPAMVSNSEFSGPQYSLPMAGQGISGFPQYPSSSAYIETPQKLAAVGGSYLVPPTRSDCQASAEGASSDSSNRKRRYEALSNSSVDLQKNSEDEIRKDSSRVAVDAAEEQKERKTEMQMGHGKQQVMEPRKENYIHVRARRGQATNSHSLAERVRREKISERMRLLQELVPGCNKITGKAVMLDEIINYVQSLQQQVEFLSMKLATVNPELNIDIDGILSRDILQSRSGNTSLQSFSPLMNPSHLHSSLQGSARTGAAASPQFPQLHQTMIDSELQNLLQAGFVSSSAVEGLSQNNWRLKPEL